MDVNFNPFFTLTNNSIDHGAIVNKKISIKGEKDETETIESKAFAKDKFTMISFSEDSYYKFKI